MERITKLLGREADIDEVGRSLYADAAEVRAAIVGGMLITCSDESERQGRDAFQRNFAEHLLSSPKLGERSFCHRTRGDLPHWRPGSSRVGRRPFPLSHPQRLRPVDHRGRHAVLRTCHDATGMKP